jgi:hypothetical protein
MTLSFVALGLILVENFAPISKSLGEVFLGAAIVILLSLSGSFYWQEWRKRRAAQSNSDAISSSDQM